MKINFYPEYNNPKFEKAAREYAAIWREEGKSIVAVIEKISGLKFKEKIINAIIYDQLSYSVPLQLEAGIATKHKKATIVHELCHRLVVGNNIKLKPAKDHVTWSEIIHKHIDLILYDIWIELYGENFAKAEVIYEIGLWNEKGISPYKKAWDWALAMPTERRQKLWKESLKSKN